MAPFCLEVTLKEDLWTWEFNSVGQLREAMEQYHVDSADVGQYDQQRRGRDDFVGDPMRPDKCCRAYQKNTAIDRAMSRLALVDKRLTYPILHLWYRRGLWAQDGSWEKVARNAGLSKQLDGYLNREIFDLVVLHGLELLLFVHRVNDWRNSGGGGRL